MKHILSRSITILLVSLFTLLLPISAWAWSGVGHFVTESIGYTDGTHAQAYTAPPNFRQASGSLDQARSSISDQDEADVYINFDYDTSGRNVYLVYTTDGTAPNKSNGAVVNAAFSKYAHPNRTWYATIPVQVAGTAVNYLFYISDSTLAFAWGRISGTVANRDLSQYETTWNESDTAAFAYTVYSHSLYVDADATGGTHNGLTWATAFTTLQDALDLTNANGGNNYEIWVAEGVYYPDEGGGHTDDERGESFTLSYNNVQLYGGFDPQASADTWGERDWEAYPTILSGDIDQDDTNSDGNRIAESWSDLQNDNAYNVFILNGVTNGPITGDTVIDGFVITAGRDNWIGNSGAGMICSGYSGGECSPTLTRLLFSGNYTNYYGGGLYNEGGNDGTANPTLTDVTFRGNYAYQGGGMGNNANPGGISSPTLTNVAFIGNTAVSSGGGIFNFGYNSSGHNSGFASPTLVNVVFSGNQADFGAGMYNDAQGAGGMSNPSLTNVTFYGNAASAEGGGLYNHSDGSFATSTPRLTNVILWGNTAGNAGPQMQNVNASPLVNYSDIQGGCPTDALCSDWIDADPLFVDANGPDNIIGTLDDNLRLGFPSPAMETGTNSGCPTTDLDALPRPNDGDADGENVCDIGAYEAGTMFCGVGLSTYQYPTQSGVAIAVTNLGTDLSCLYVDEMGIDHPQATGTVGDSGIKTGRYWLIHGLTEDHVSDASDYLVNLTLPHNLPDHTLAAACKYTGGAGYGWECSRTGSDGATVWRNGVDSFSDWAVGYHVGPTAVTLSSFSVTSPVGWVGLLVGLLVMVGGTAVYWRGKR